MKYNAYLLVFCMLLLSSCFKDKGNYDYTDINDITIGDKGFAADTIYNVRANVDRLTITPELNFSLDPEVNMSGSLSELKNIRENVLFSETNEIWTAS